MREWDDDAEWGWLLGVDTVKGHRAVLRGGTAARGVEEGDGGAVGGARRFECEGDVLGVDGLLYEIDFDPGLARPHSEGGEAREECCGGVFVEFMRRGYAAG